MIGIIYHVIDKTSGETVRVGSTIRSLGVRWSMYDKKKFSNHFLLEVKRIESSDIDVYNKENPHCSFLWHLVASEHIEMIRASTYRTGPLANQLSPLQQKYIGFDGWEIARQGGLISKQKKAGVFGLSFEERLVACQKGGEIVGRMNVESGHLQSISSKGGKVAGAIIGKRNAESGWMKEVQQMGLGKGGKIGGPKGMHIRWHVRRGIISLTCAHCKVA